LEESQEVATPKPNRLKKWIRQKLLTPYLKRIPKDQKTLDLGCGYGFSFEINPGFYGLDADDGCLGFCAAKGYKIVKATLLDSLPFKDNSFDTCFSHDVLEHFELGDVENIFRNVQRILRKGGVFLNIVPNRLGYEYGVRTNAGHKHNITVEEIQDLSRKTGYLFVKSYSSPLPPIFHRFFVHNKYVTVCRKI
jgi:SAM-dependent methyltransferase